MMKYLAERMNWGQSSNSILFIYGRGGNGKSTFVNLIKSVFEGMYGVLEAGYLDKTNQNKGGLPNPFLMNLDLYKLLIGVDIINNTLDSDLIKQLTGKI